MRGLSNKKGEVSCVWEINYIIWPLLKFVTSAGLAEFMKELI